MSRSVGTGRSASTLRWSAWSERRSQNARWTSVIATVQCSPTGVRSSSSVSSPRARIRWVAARLATWISGSRGIGSGPLANGRVLAHGPLNHADHDLSRPRPATPAGDDAADPWLTRGRARELDSPTGDPRPRERGLPPPASGARGGVTGEEAAVGASRSARYSVRRSSETRRASARARAAHLLARLPADRGFPRDPQLLLGGGGDRRLVGLAQLHRRVGDRGVRRLAVRAGLRLEPARGQVIDPASVDASSSFMWTRSRAIVRPGERFSRATRARSSRRRARQGRG